MPENRPQTSFCSACGAALQPPSRFCATCGNRTRRPLLTGLAVFSIFVAAGAAGLYYDSLGRAPVKRAVPGSPQVKGQAQEAHRGPRRHPDIELPADVVTFLDQLGRQAEAAPEDIVVWQKLARARYRAGLLNRSHMPTAARAVEHLLKLDPDNLEALRTKANIVYDAGRYADAEAAFRLYLELDPGDPSVTTDLASALLFQGRRAEALAAYEEAVAADPDFFQARFNLGIALQADGRTEEALASLEQARGLTDRPEQLQRVDEAIAAAKGAAVPGDTPGSDARASGASTEFQRKVEETMRAHPIAGPKIASFQWQAAARAKVLMRAFPMHAMPPVVRNKFKSKLNASLVRLAAEYGVTAGISLELVDEPTGKTMDRLDGKEMIGAFDPQP